MMLLTQGIASRDPWIVPEKIIILHLAKFYEQVPMAASLNLTRNVSIR
jgi:hypothetical protein